MAILPPPTPETLQALSNNGWMDPTAKVVYHQLVPDFPHPIIEWVKHTVWIGPVAVPPIEIDTSNSAAWTASHEPAKVQIHVNLIKQNNSKPIILAQLPGHDKLFIIDAHHRFLAYQALGKNPIAYIGIVKPEDTEKALTMHSKQFSGKSRLDGV